MGNRNDDLSQSGLKSTKKRTAILHILEQSKEPLAAEQVFLELKKLEIAVSLATVYRTLEVLSEKNLALKIMLPGDARTLYEYNFMEHKHYLICLGCRKILTIKHCPLGNYEKWLAEETNFVISGHKLDVYGYCPECQAKM